MSEESFTYLEEDDGSQSLLDTDAVDQDVLRIVAEIIADDFEDHSRASDELRTLSATTSPAYMRLVAEKVAVMVGQAALFSTSPLFLPPVLARLQSFIMTYRTLRPWSEHVHFAGLADTDNDDGARSDGDTGKR